MQIRPEIQYVLPKHGRIFCEKFYLVRHVSVSYFLLFDLGILIVAVVLTG